MSACVVGESVRGLGVGVRAAAGTSGAAAAPPASTNKPVTSPVGEVESGADGVEFHLDYLCLMLRSVGTDPRPLMSLVGEMCFGEADAAIFEDTGHGAEAFAKLYRGPAGSRVLHSAADGCQVLKVEFKGEGCGLVSGREFGELIVALQGRGVEWHASRVDFAWDGVGFSVDQVVEAVERGDVRTFAKCVEHRDCRMLKGERVAGFTGKTVYVGARGGRRQVCIYDGRGFVRVELRLSRERATDGVCRVLLGCSSGERWSGWIPELDGERIARGLLMDALAFVDRSQNGKVERCPVLPWWATFVEGVVRVRHVIPRVAAGVERATRWVCRQVMPTLALVCEYMESQEVDCRSWLLHEVLDKGRARWSAWQKSLVRGLGLQEVAMA